MKRNTFWWILGLAIVGFLAWIGIRAYRNHLRMEEERGEYDNEAGPLSETSVGTNHPEMAEETTAN